MPTITEERGTLSTPDIRPGQSTSQRRSQRILFSMPLRVSGKLVNNSAFAEYTSTLIVNAHGGLILLQQAVSPGQIVTLKNVRTEEEVPCTVVYIHPRASGVQEVGVEFEQPNSRFWRVLFPPEDWTPHSPEAKGFVNKPGPPVAAKSATLKK